MTAETLIPLMTKVPQADRAQKAAFILLNWNISIYRNLLLSASGLTDAQIVQLTK